jgi:hypothetical protein
MIDFTKNVSPFPTPSHLPPCTEWFWTQQYRWVHDRHIRQQMMWTISNNIFFVRDHCKDRCQGHHIQSWQQLTTHSAHAQDWNQVHVSCSCSYEIFIIHEHFICRRYFSIHCCQYFFLHFIYEQFTNLLPCLEGSEHTPSNRQE